VLIHTISPNIYRTPSEALQAFYHFSEVGDWSNTFGSFQRLFVIYVGATAMYFIGKILKKRWVAFFSLFPEICVVLLF